MDLALVLFVIAGSLKQGSVTLDQGSMSSNTVDGLLLLNLLKEQEHATVPE